MPGVTSSIGLQAVKEANGYFLKGGITTQQQLRLNGADLEVSGANVDLVAQQAVQAILPDMPVADLLAFQTLTAKGSLLTSDGTEAVDLPVGTDGQVLFADSTQAGGLAYKTIQVINTEVVNASQAMAANTAYVIDDASAALVELSLPANTAAVGAIVKIYGGTNANRWRITQAAGDQIRSLDISTTAGASGNLESLVENDSIELQHRGAGVWQVADCMGSFQLN